MLVLAASGPATAAAHLASPAPGSEAPTTAPYEGMTACFTPDGVEVGTQGDDVQFRPVIPASSAQPKLVDAPATAAHKPPRPRKKRKPVDEAFA